MKTQLTIEQSDALLKSGERLALIDPRSDKVYVLVDQSTHEQPMDAQRRRRSDDEAAIQHGIDDMEAVREMSLGESRARTNAALLARQDCDWLRSS